MSRQAKEVRLGILLSGGGRTMVNIAKYIGEEKLDAQIVDMESAAVVQVARINGVPVLAVRSCSDLAGGSGSSTAKDEIQEFFEVAADNSASFVLEFLKQL